MSYIREYVLYKRIISLTKSLNIMSLIGFSNIFEEASISSIDITNLQHITFINIFGMYICAIKMTV